MSRAVIDQPGLRTFVIGLMLALGFGFGLKSQITSSRVEKSLQKSIRILEKDFNIDFELAEVRLSKWGLPLPHLIIYKVRISPKKQFCQNSQIFIDELELPIQYRTLFLPDEAIHLIRAKNIDVRLVDLDKCFEPAKSLAVQPGQSSESSKAVDASKIFSQKTRTQLKEISIEQLKIVSVKDIDQPLVFKQMRFFLNYQDSKLSQIDLKSKFYSIKDRRTDIYFLIADFNASIKPDQTQNVEVAMQLKGRLLDGDVQVFLNASSLSHKLNYEVKTRKVSIKAYAPLLARYKSDLNLDMWPLSTSFYMLGEAEKTAKESKAFFKFKNFEAAGENMSVRTSEIDVETNAGRHDIKPFTLTLNHFSLTPLKSILSDHFDFQSVESLGFLKGILKYDEAQTWSFDGFLEKAELIFSNRGTRELQVVDSVQVNLNHKSNLLNFKFDQMKFNQNDILGGLEGDYSELSKSLQLKLDIEGQILNQNIWKQLTQVQQSPSIKLNWTYKKASDERHQLKLISPVIDFQGFHLTDVHIDFLQSTDRESKSLALSLKSAKTDIHVAGLRPQMIKAFFNEQTDLQEPQYSALKTQVSLEGADWKSMSFDLEASLVQVETAKNLEHIKAKGDWKSDNSLTGIIQVQNPKRTLKYNVVKNSREEIDFISDKKDEP